jgi:hypothetical protein
MSLITNRSFLYVNCISVDVIRKILLALSEWLNACVAFDRMISVAKGPRFDKNKIDMDNYNCIYFDTYS